MLTRCPGVYPERRHANLLEPRRQVDGGPLPVLQSAAELDRHRHAELDATLTTAAAMADRPGRIGRASAEPAPVRITLRTGQPMLMSSMSGMGRACPPGTLPALED